jgi:hypothetical protein
MPDARGQADLPTALEMLVTGAVVAAPMLPRRAVPARRR